MCLQFFLIACPNLHREILTHVLLLHIEGISRLKSFWIKGIKRTLILYLFTHYLLIMNTGKIKFFVESKGFGFIVHDDNNEELFFHVSGFVDEVQKDDDVSFDIIDGKKGPNAINIKRQ